MTKSTSSNGERIQRGRVPSWLKQCCQSRYGRTRYCTLLGHALDTYGLADNLTIDHAGTLWCANGMEIYISEPYSRDGPETCPMWKDFQGFAESLGLRCEWSPIGAWHEATRQFCLIPPDDLVTHLHQLRIQCDRLRIQREKAFYADIIPLIQQMRDEGKSFNAIAIELGMQGYETRRGGFWSANSVSRVLKRAVRDANRSNPKQL